MVFSLSMELTNRETTRLRGGRGGLRCLLPILCEMWKMRKAHIPGTLNDKTKAPIGKKWSYDTLTLKGVIRGERR